MQLWNIRTNKLIHSFAGWGGSAVLTLVQSPAVDVVGAGLEDGGVVLHNLRYDETLMKFRQDWGPVVGLAFRTGERGVNVGCVFESVPLIHLFIILCLYVYNLSSYMNIAVPLQIVHEASSIHMYCTCNF